MKTPMQELIWQLNKVEPQHFCSIETIKGWAEELLKKEQQVMCEFAIDYTMQTKTAYDFHRAKFNNEL